MNERKKFYKTVFILVLPMALQNLINVGITSTDVFMLGKVGEKALSGASLAGQVQFIMTLIFFGITSGAAVLIAQYWGKEDIPSIEHIFGISMKFSIAVSVFFTIIALCFSYPIMRIFTSDPLVIEEGIKYLRIVCLSYFFMSITMIYLNTMRSIERVLISTIVYFCSFLINVCFNSILIFGLFGAPRLEVQGAAIGTLIARICEFLIILYYNKKRNRIVPFKLSFLRLKDDLLRKDFFKYSMPVILNELMWGAGVSLNAAILGHLGSSVTAAHSVAQVTRQLALVIGFGISNATAIMIGKAIGEGNTEVAKTYGTRFVKLSLLVGALGSVVVLIARPIVMSTMSLPDTSIKYLSMMMFIMAYYVIAQSFNTTMVVGVFRAGGDTKFGLYLDIITMWGGSIFVGALAAFVFKFSVPVIYIILLCDEIIKIPFTAYRYKSYKWLNNVTR